MLIFQWSLQTQALHGFYLRYFERDKALAATVAERDTNPNFRAITGTEESIGVLQKSYIKELQLVMNVLKRGPYNFDDAKESGLIDGAMYHQDLLAAFAEAGVKTWSVRKYLDAVIAQAIFGDIDQTKWVLPQLFKQRKGQANVRDSGLRQLDGTNKQERSQGMKFQVSLGVPMENPKIEDCFVQMDFFLPRTVGLVYLDNAIEGFVCCWAI